MADPRAAAVEDNLIALFTAAGGSDVLHRDPVDDVVALRSDVPFPMFNAVTGAHPDIGAARAGEIVDSYVAAGLPWMWWLTPSTTPAGLEALLEARGLVREDVPGMYADLAAAPPVPEVPGLTIGTTDDVDGFVDMMVTGFGFPEFARRPTAAVMRIFPETINLLARLDGRAVACGTAYPLGATSGLYNIATAEEARGRGIGYAVTATLMQLSREAGAGHAVLHSSEDGRPVYERAGFVEVCRVPQYVWLPGTGPD